MNVVQFESLAFIFPDDMDAFRKRYGADVICVDGEEGVIMVIGPNDSDWRSIPEDKDNGIVKLRSVE